MENQNVPQKEQSLVTQPVAIQVKPKINYLIISFFVLICCLVFGLIGYYLGKQNQNKTSSSGNILLPTSIATKPPKETVSPTSIPTTQSTIVSSVPETITLKVAAMGGSLNIDAYNFVFTFNRKPNDTITILKRDENEYKNFPNFPQGAIDKGFVIKHENAKLEILPVFESGGIPLDKKLTPVIISNPKLADGPIFRIKNAELGSYGSQEGWFYTTQYRDGPNDCAPWGTNVGQPNPPACILTGANVITKDGQSLEITCYAEGGEVNWCDKIIESLSVSTNKLN